LKNKEILEDNPFQSLRNIIMNKEDGNSKEEMKSLEFNPLLYLVDINKYLEKNSLGKIEYNLDDFTKESLANPPEMGWLNLVNCNLFAPIERNINDQKNRLDTLFSELRSTAIYLTHGFCPGAFPQDFKEPVIALDTETTGLDTRIMYDYDGNLIVKTKLVGFSLAVSDTEGYYFPVKHSESDGILNWDLKVILNFIERLQREFFIIYHNAYYDREILAINGVSYFRPWPYFVDTQILDFFNDVNNKSHGLKFLSEKLLNRKMIEIYQLFSFDRKLKKGENISFDRLPAKVAYVYGCSDAINTFGLFQIYASKDEKENSFFNEAIPLTIDHKSIDVIRNLSRGGAPIDFDYVLYACKDMEYRLLLLEEGIYKYVGRKFDIGSPDQISKILFNEYKIPILSGEERGKNGNYSTREEVLFQLFEKHSDYTILRYIVLYRKFINVLSKSFMKMVMNSYIDALLPYTRFQIQYSQTIIPTARFSSASNKGKTRIQVKTTKAGNITHKFYQGSWDCGLNSQGIDNPHFILKKARKIKKISSMAGLDLENPYPSEVIQNLIKRIASV
jgi:hypothetical protein